MSGQTLPYGATTHPGFTTPDTHPDQRAASRARSASEGRGGVIGHPRF